MIIGHEIGHLKAGHLDRYWFILPGTFIPIYLKVYLLLPAAEFVK
jgi:predicted Zn-dependent protease